jgi:excisionase family DNA binding protein
MPVNGYLTVAETAARLGVTMRRVRQLIHDGAIQAKPISARFLLIEAQSLAEYESRRRPAGRPQQRPN